VKYLRAFLEKPAPAPKNPDTYREAPTKPTKPPEDCAGKGFVGFVSTHPYTHEISEAAPPVANVGDSLSPSTLAPAPPVAPGDEDEDVEANIAWLDRRAGEIRQEQRLPKPEAERLAYLELKARLDGAPAPDVWTMTASRAGSRDRLHGPRCTPWGTLVWSDPTEPSIEAFDVLPVPRWSRFGWRPT
jgi:hypothetical protein